MQNIMLPSLLKAPQQTSSIGGGGDDGGDGVGESKGFVFSESVWDDTEE